MDSSDGRTALGISPRWAGVLAYALGWMTGLAVVLLEKENRFVRFHAVQSIIVFGALTVLSIVLPWVGTIFSVVPVIGRLIQGLAALLDALLTPAWIALAIFLAIQAYQMKEFRVPYVAPLVDRYV